MQFWGSREERALGRMLREHRSEPPRELVESIERSVAQRRPTRFLGARAGIALGLTAALGVAFGAAGGSEYAAAAAGKAGAAVKKVGSIEAAKQSRSASTASSPGASRSASGDQYGPDRQTICHRTPSGRSHTLVLPFAAAEAHLRQHRGSRGAGADTEGACT